MQGAQVQSLVGELDPAGMLQLRPGAAKINKYFLKMLKPGDVSLHS